MDLRDALKFLLNTQMASIEANLKFYQHNSEKAIFNGQTDELESFSL